MRTTVLVATLLLFVLLCRASIASSDRRIVASGGQQIISDSRIALVIGNSAYKEAPLKNPVNDANAMADPFQVYCMRG